MVHVSDGDEPDDDDTLVLLGVYSADAEINDASGCKSINVNVTLSSEIVPMQLDTGAFFSPLSQKTPTEGSCQNIHYKPQIPL